VGPAITLAEKDRKAVMSVVLDARESDGEGILKRVARKCVEKTNDLVKSDGDNEHREKKEESYQTQRVMRNMMVVAWFCAMVEIDTSSPCSIGIGYARS
jgi:hypothetical protein